MNEPWTATIVGLALAGSYVLPFYVWRSPYPRDHHRTIVRRGCTVVGSCLLASYPVYLYLGCQDLREYQLAIGITAERLLWGWIQPLLVTAALFMGSLVQWLDEVRSGREPLGSYYKSPVWRAPVAWRNLVSAPVTEELMFRGFIIPVLIHGGFSKTTAIFTAPLFFGLAHVHHLHELTHHQGQPMKRAILVAAFQFMYTILFGWLAAFFFLSQRSLSAAIVPHCFCNFMGFPQFGKISDCRQPRFIITMYIVGVSLFVLGIRTMSSNAL